MYEMIVVFCHFWLEVCVDLRHCETAVDVAEIE